MATSSLPPGSVLVLGALLFPLLRGRAAQAWLLVLPVLSGLHFLSLPAEHAVHLTLLGYELTPIRIDALSRVWGLIFHVAALLAAVYALHHRDSTHHAAAMAYAGSAIGAVFAGDLLTLFLWWEWTALSSSMLIWAARNPRAYKAGMRYLLMHILSGVLLLGGAVLLLRDTGSLQFDHLGLGSPATGLIFLAFGIKCAFPLLHNWMADAYPAATPAGTVFLGVYSTKLAVYALARGYAGTDCLLWIGAGMVLFPLVYAALENNLRRVLVYSLNNQLGFMVIGIGLGTPLALNGVAAHAFCHVLYKSLLFMAMGAVLYRTGHCRGSDLGGLCRTMPWTAACCLIGAASIGAVPFFAGFVSKTLIMAAAAEEHLTALYLLTLIASGAAFALADLRVPYTAFLGPDSGLRPPEAPWNMRIAMALTASLAVGIGWFPDRLYSILPHAMDYHPYTLEHVLAKAQLLVFAALAFALTLRLGYYPAAIRAIHLDTDWLYRRFAPAVIRAAARGLGRLHSALTPPARRARAAGAAGIRVLAGPSGLFSRTWSTGAMVLGAAILLGIYLVIYYLH